MSVIVLVIDDELDAKILMSLHRVLNISLKLLQVAFETKLPILEVEIFEGDYQENARLIRSVLKIIGNEKIIAKFYEIPFGERYFGSLNIENWRISLDLVYDILEAADAEIERQQDL
jgi:hypothetical protein